MRPLIRWTFGRVKRPGQEVFQMALRRFRAIYPEFDCVVCYNNLMYPDQLRWLQRLNVPLYRQDTEDLEYPLMSVEEPSGWKGAMPGWGWKLCPPRLRPDAHELWVDNDLIIRQRLPEINRWLKSKKFIIAKGHRYNPEYYGNFAHLVKDQKKYCAGLFGLPPNFDFKKEILRLSKKVLQGKPLGYYDEQGLVTAIVTSRPHITAHHVETIKRLPEKPLPMALHFITTNRYHTHEDWKNYKCSILM